MEDLSSLPGESDGDVGRVVKGLGSEEYRLNPADAK